MIEESQWKKRNFYFFTTSSLCDYTQRQRKEDWRYVSRFKGQYFFLHRTQSIRSHLKTVTQREGERCNFFSKLGFREQYCVNISVLRREERDYAAVFISVITVNITVSGSRPCACFICHDELPYSHTGMLERLSGAERQPACKWGRLVYGESERERERGGGGEGGGGVKIKHTTKKR